MSSSALLWIVVLPLLGTLVPLVAQRWGKTACAVATAILPATALLLVLQFHADVVAQTPLTASWHWIPSLGLNLSFHLDGLGFLFALLILGIGLLVILYARYYLSDEDPMGRFYAYLILFMTAMLGVVLSNNLIQLWMFWELTSVSSFLLISFWSHRSDARRGARMALAITGAGGLALLAGLLLIGQVVGSFDLQTVLASGALVRAHDAYPVILGLILLGAFTKSAQFPFHFWLPHAMAAPTPVSAYLHSATMVKAGIFLLARFFPVLAGTEMWFLVVGLTGLATLLLGAYTALFKHDLKGLLAYSTISHLGLITLLLGMHSELAAVAAVFHIINHAVFKASLFMAAGIIDHESGTRDMRKLNGLWNYMPHTATLAMVASASMAGIPLFNGFLSKEMFFAETLHPGALGSLSWMIPVFATVGAALSVAYSVRFIHDVFFNGEPIDLPKTPHEPPRYMKVPVEILVALCILVGIFPEFMVGELLAAASQSVIRTELPEYGLSIWHGFNLPLMMSLAAVIGGAFIYYHRGTLFQLQAQFPERDMKAEFEKGVVALLGVAHRIMAWIDNGSLQRYSLLLVLAAIVMLAAPLTGLVRALGDKSLMPVDPFAAIAGFLLCVSALATVVLHRQRLVALLMLSVAGLIVSMAFSYFSAPDLALTQLTVEVVTIVLLLLALFFLPQSTPKETDPRRIARDLGLAAIAGGIIGTLSYALMTRSLDSIADYFVANSKTGGGGTNVVNVILVDFRGFDTLGEITVLGIAALGIFGLISRMPLYLPARDAFGNRWSNDVHPMMLGMVSRWLLPMALLVSVFIFLRGHNQPGGGFIAGLITAIAILQQYIANGVEWVRGRLRIHYAAMIGTGLGIALFSGVGSWFFGRPFLTTWFDYFSWPVVGKFELASAMVFDLGVYLTVIGATLMILANLGELSTRHRPDSRGES
ncbi:MAG: monovalent cation/H+ antiporter subunit A [Hahellaceae bacterium]|nr:monovalent cation/H+ antiporter subunit A [Hahellaceae bacterium]